MINGDAPERTRSTSLEETNIVCPYCYYYTSLTEKGMVNHLTDMHPDKIRGE